MLIFKKNKLKKHTIFNNIVKNVLFIYDRQSQKIKKIQIVSLY
jgi:hypothetical protein